MVQLNWHHILDMQPEDGIIIIQVDEPYEMYVGNYIGADFKNHYSMGMRQYKSHGQTTESLEKWRKDNGLKPSNWWWIYAKDFPFPDLK